MHETISYYLLNDSVVYNVLLDASRAFDRVNYVQLFRLLVKRNLCPAVTRFLLHLYSNQSMRVRWDTHTSDPRQVQNGVRQGGVMSPLLFSVYMDELLIRLKNCGVGCYVGNQFMGAVAYADDVSILAPNVASLRQLLIICEKFAEDFDVKFNASKSVIVVHGPDAVNRNINVHFMNETIPVTDYLSTSKHLGIEIGNRNMQARVRSARAQLYGQTNVVLSQFNHVDRSIRYKLFKTYCVNLYGCELWDVSHPSFLQYCIAFRKSQRNVLNLPYRTHTKYLPHLSDDIPMDLNVCRRIAKFISRTPSNSNPMIKTSYKLLTSGSISNTGKSLSHLVNITKRSRHGFGTSPQIPAETFIDLDVPFDLISIVKELSGNLYQNILTHPEVNAIIYDICVN